LGVRRQRINHDQLNRQISFIQIRIALKFGIHQTHCHKRFKPAICENAVNINDFHELTDIPSPQEPRFTLQKQEFPASYTLQFKQKNQFVSAEVVEIDLSSADFEALLINLPIHPKTHITQLPLQAQTVSPGSKRR